MTNRTNEAYRIVRETETGQVSSGPRKSLVLCTNSQATELAPEASAQVNVCAYFDVHTQEKIAHVHQERGRCSPVVDVLHSKSQTGNCPGAESKVDETGRGHRREFCTAVA